METRQFLEASRFLEILDPTSNKFTFQTFDDTEPKRKGMAQVIHGSLAQCWPKLKRLNMLKAGVHVSVQETDLLGRKDKNIIHLRSICADNDSQSIKMADLPLKPSMEIETSPENTHLYYLLNSKLSTNNGFHGDFQEIQKRLIELGADPGAKPLNHTFRMPGFLNWKRAKPHPTTIKHVEMNFLADPVRYDWDQLKSSFKPQQTTSEDDIKAFFENTSDNTPYIIEPFKIALAASALHVINPDCEYDDWLNVGMALHFASQGGRQGYDLFQTWSREGDQYKNHDWPRQWDYFQAKPDKKPITIKTLYHIAKEFGWDSRYTLDADDIEKYIRQERENCFEYINQFYGLIPVKNGMQLIYQGKNELGYHGYHLMSQAGADDFFAPMKIPFIKKLTNSTKIVFERMYPKWKEWEKRNIYKGFIFAPSAEISINKKEATLLKQAERYNTYVGLTDEGIPGNCDIVLNHIKTVWCKGDKDRYDYILNWLARMYQYPGLPAETLIIITSRQGAGKNIILDEIVKSFGRFGKTDNAGDDLTGDFNAILMDSVFILVGEAAFDSTIKQRSVIKTLATQDRVSSTKKYEDTREIHNCVHLICLSNEERPIRIDIGDRRHFIIACDNRYVGDFDYFTEFARQIKEEKVMSKFIHYLRNRDISDFRPQIMPKMEKGLKSALVARDPRGVLSFVRTALELNNFFYTIDAGLNEGYGMEKENHIPVDRLYVAYQTHCHELQSKKHRVDMLSKMGFGRKLNEIFPGINFKKKRLGSPDNNGKRPYYYDAAPIEVLRSRYDDYVGAPHDWDDDEEELPDFLK